MSEVSGDREELTCVQGQGRQPGGDTPRLRPGAARRSHLMPEARSSDPEEPSEPEARAGGREEQQEEQWLHRRKRA